ncbi:MAG: release factor glutamine methyltransferase [Alphaproteobacteria bacterium]|nr:release factor glutamine methyltransferase [Alphaproteobacteria bacterium]
MTFSLSSPAMERDPASANTGCAAAGHDTLQGTSISAARRLLAQAFRRHGVDSPELDARVLIGHALGLDHAQLASAADRVLNADVASVISGFAARRLAHEPVARIVGMKEFWGLEFRVTPGTLVPRPETETVVETALAAIDARGLRWEALRLLDLGTGSGALLLALLSELPNAIGIGTDISLPALATARENAERLGFAARAHFVACDFAAALRGPFDLVVSNPPYIASADIAGLAPEVREHDPHLALDGGSDGLDTYRAIAADIGRILAPGGAVVLELGADQAAAVTALLAKGGIVTERVKDDLAGHPRALLAHRTDQNTIPKGQK